jgi:hypothetical protein
MAHFIDQKLLGHDHVGQVPPDIVVKALGDHKQFVVGRFTKDFMQVFTVLQRYVK